MECTLKALILVATPASQKLHRLSNLKTHDLIRLRKFYFGDCGGSWPETVDDEMTLLATWSSELRYEAATIPAGSAVEYLESVERFHSWAEERM